MWGGRRPGPLAAVVLLLVVYGALYARALGHGFVWDDRTNVVEATQFEAPLARGLRATQHDFLDRSLLGRVGLPVPYESYRPLLFLSYALDDALFGRSPRAMHAHNLLLGALCALAAAWVAAPLLGDARAGVAVAALFLLHPVQTEALCYVSARGDLLCALFALLAAGAFLRAADATRPAARAALGAAAALAFALSLAAKEASATLPAALALLALARRRGRASALPLLALAAAGVAYAAARVAVVGGARSSLDGGNAGAALALLPAFALEYLRVFAVPNDLSIERPLPAGAPLLWLAGAGVAAASAWALRQRRGGTGRELRLAAAGVGWFAALLAPSALAARTMGVAADRYATLPLWGVCLAAVALGARLAREPRVRGWLPAGAAAWGALLLAVTALQVSVWRDNESLYRNSLAVEPASSMAHYRVGVLAARAGDWERARRDFERALTLDAENFRAWNNAGVAYLNLGRHAQAERAILRALELSGSANFRAWNNLATLRVAQRRRVEACDALGRALAINPDYAVARANRARNCAGAAAPAPAAEAG